MRFENPELLFFFLLVPLFTFGFIWKRRKRKAEGEKIFSKELFSNLSESYLESRENLKRFLFMLGVVFLIIAFSRPQLGTNLSVVKRKGIDIMVALDTSTSMLAEDMKPNRIEKAKLEIAGLIDRLRGDRIGLISFAGSAYVQCPLTLDYSAAKIFLDVLDTEMIPDPGTAIGEAIEKAISAFPESGKKYKVLILLTDGEDHGSKPEEFAQKAQEAGIRIFPIGIGTSQGEPIPIINDNNVKSGYKKDSKGETVMSRLDEATLQKIAVETDGKYFRASGSEIELDKIYEDISSMEKKEMESRFMESYKERFQIFIFIAFALFTAEFLIGNRKRKWKLLKFKKSSLTTFIISAIFFINSIQAFGESVEKRNNKGNSFYEQGKFKEALELYKNAQVDRPEAPEIHYNMGNTLNKLESYDQSVQEFGNSLEKAKDNLELNSRTHFNLGNSYCKLKQYDKAAKEYINSLKLDPENLDTKHNLEYALRMQQQMKQQQEQQQQEKQDQNKEDKQKNEDQNKQEQDKQENQQQQQQQNENNSQNPKTEQDKNETSSPDYEQKQAEMSKEDANLLLDAIKDDEKALQKDIIRMKLGARRQSPYDW